LAAIQQSVQGPIRIKGGCRHQINQIYWILEELPPMRSEQKAHQELE
jgi:hypothetical protein